MDEFVLGLSQKLGLPPQILWVLIGAFGFWLLSKVFKRSSSTSSAGSRTVNIKPETPQTSVGVDRKAVIPGQEFILSQEALDNIKDALRSGNKIKAIKIFRTETGASLSDAKGAIERM